MVVGGGGGGVSLEGGEGLEGVQFCLFALQPFHALLMAAAAIVLFVSSFPHFLQINL
jgi:hypothetical protein